MGVQVVTICDSDIDGVAVVLIVNLWSHLSVSGVILSHLLCVD